KMSKKRLTMIMETNKFNGTNCNDLLRNLRIVLDFENNGYVFHKPLLPTAFPEGSLPEKRVTFDKWLEANRKIHNIILASITNDRGQGQMMSVCMHYQLKWLLEEGGPTTPLQPRYVCD
ncbi:UNVERIFIED_CONTAM: hypothetical protein Sangu_3125500, partial [Sesamum angustifolium]